LEKRELINDSLLKPGYEDISSHIWIETKLDVLEVENKALNFFITPVVWKTNEMIIVGRKIKSKVII
jgi:hypothetical protein